MKSTTLSLILATAVSMFLASAAPAAPAFDQANASFAAGHYHAAIDQYQAMLNHDGFSAPVLFNLGNAFYRDGQFGHAILSYERAHVLAPNDGEIAANLQLARAKAGMPAPKMTVADQAARIVSPNTLAWIGSIALIAICLAIGVGRFLPRFAYARTVIAFSVMTLAAVAISFAIRWPDFNRGIVVATTAPARIAPAGNAAESFMLKAGEPVGIYRTYGQFDLVHASAGRAGWVSDADIGRVFSKPATGLAPARL